MDEDRDNSPGRPATERADELLTRAGQTAGIFASLLGRRIARVAAFAREEVEDMWAEAQSIRQQAPDAETNQDVKARASEGTDVSQREAEEEKPEKSPQGDGRASAATDAAATTETEEPKPESEQDAEPDEEAENIKATPTARRRAEELGVDLQEVEGTGAEGQITVGDVKKKAESNA
jgi:pyruvate/2-oxoglutarate dehydrogenase complex dihydrolipoamide acyltransferase (E2) component